MIRLYGKVPWNDGLYPLHIPYIGGGQLLEIMCFVCKRIVCIPIEEVWTEYRYTVFQCRQCKITIGTVEVRKLW